MLTLIIRAILVYLLVLVVFRLMGKRQIGQMQPFELVLTLVIADLATIPMAESAIPTLHGIVPLITLVVVHFGLTFLSKKSTKVGEIISGKPVIIVNPQGVDIKALDQLDITIDDLMEAIRGAGFFKLEEIHYAIMETNGVVNVLPKCKYAPVTNGDLNNNVPENTLPYTIICEGSLMQDNLKIAGISENFVTSLLKRKQVKNIKDVAVFTLDKDGNCYLQENEKAFRLFKINLKGLGIANE